MKAEDVIDLVEKHQNDYGGTITILERLQAKYGYLPEEALRIISDKTGKSLVDIYGVATFYGSFSLKPRGKHLCSVCLGTACHVSGGPKIVEEFERQLGISASETTADREFTLETVNCLGACALGPVVVIDGRYSANVRTSKVLDVIAKARVGTDVLEIQTDQRIFPVNVSCPRCNHGLMDKNFYIDGYPSIRITVSFGRNHGWMRLSCLYGSYSVESEYSIPNDTIVHFFCPHCHAELIGHSDCPDCGAPMIPMLVRGGGVVQICSRRGCKGHMLDLGGIIHE
jgi:NADH-quinone oxidoreductase subunit E